MISVDTKKMQALQDKGYITKAQTTDGEPVWSVKVRWQQAPIILKDYTVRDDGVFVGWNRSGRMLVMRAVDVREPLPPTEEQKHEKGDEPQVAFPYRVYVKKHPSRPWHVVAPSFQEAEKWFLTPKVKAMTFTLHGTYQGRRSGSKLTLNKSDVFSLLSATPSEDAGQHPAPKEPAADDKPKHKPLKVSAGPVGPSMGFTALPGGGQLKVGGTYEIQFLPEGTVWTNGGTKHEIMKNDGTIPIIYENIKTGMSGKHHSKSSAMLKVVSLPDWYVNPEPSEEPVLTPGFAGKPGLHVGDLVYLKDMPVGTIWQGMGTPPAKCQIVQSDGQKDVWWVNLTTLKKTKLSGVTASKLEILALPSTYSPKAVTVGGKYQIGELPDGAVWANSLNDGLYQMVPSDTPTKVMYKDLKYDKVLKSGVNSSPLRLVYWPDTGEVDESGFEPFVEKQLMVGHKVLVGSMPPGTSWMGNTGVCKVLLNNPKLKLQFCLLTNGKIKKMDGGGSPREILWLPEAYQKAVAAAKGDEVFKGIAFSAKYEDGDGVVASEDLEADHEDPYDSDGEFAYDEA